MAEKRCGRRGKIAKRIRTSQIQCYKFGIKVTIDVTPNGNCCTKTNCPHNMGLIEKEE